MGCAIHLISEVFLKKTSFLESWLDRWSKLSFAPFFSVHVFLLFFAVRFFWSTLAKNLKRAPGTAFKVNV